MISSNIQLLSFFISVCIGFMYFYFYRIVFNRLWFKTKMFIFLKDIIYILIVSTISIYVYYIVNNGYVHYSYVIFWVIGYMIGLKVNNYVKRQ